ncbi:MAG: hypothetical protein ACRCVT_06475 [Leadbetterella sp.]
MYFWEAQNRLFIAAENFIIVYNGSTGAQLNTYPGMFSTLTGQVGFTEFLYDDGTSKVVVTDGTTLHTIDVSGVLVQATSPDLPSHLPQIVFLDGFLFLIKRDTADIYNSNLNDPLLYTAGDFLTAEMLPDKATYLTRLNNYLVVMGGQSIEYFWNAGNATASPLQRNDTPIKLAGLLGGVASLGNRLFIVGSYNESQPNVFILEDFKLIPIGNEAIRRHLVSVITSGSLVNLTGTIISQEGHDFYMITTDTASYVYDIEAKLWVKWAWQNQANFDIAVCLNCQTSAGIQTYFSLKSNYTVYKFDIINYRDVNVDYTVSFTTDNEDFGSYNQKTMHRFSLWADKPTMETPLLVQWTDNDYLSYNNGVTLDLFQELPCVYQLGRFRRRAFKITLTPNQRLRFKAIEVDINLGNH